MTARHLIALCMTALLALQACGQTGDLYWPEDDKTAVDEDEAQSES